MWLMFTPAMICPWTFEKIPDCTKLHDGGKWLCGLQQVHEARQLPGHEYGVGKHYNTNNNAPACVVYCMGSRNAFAFEKRVRGVAPGCEIQVWDPTVKEEIAEHRRVYDQMHLDYGFGGVDNPNPDPFPIKSLETIMKELGHTHVDYLKVDVEGFEFEFFEQVDWSKVTIGQLLVEVHPKKGHNAGYMNEVFRKLEAAGFYVISGEPVTYKNLGQAELVFLHKNWRPSGMLLSE